MYPCSQGIPLPNNPTPTSNLNFGPERIATATVIAHIAYYPAPHFVYTSEGLACIFVSRTTDVVIDVLGYFTDFSLTWSAFATSFTALHPARLFDSRADAQTVDGLEQGTGALAGDSITTVSVGGRRLIPIDATAVALSVTVTEPTGDGYVVVHPCDTPRPPTSHLNFTAGTTVANLVIASMSTTGDVCVFASAATHLVVDVSGYFGATSAYHPVPSSRLLDTRQGAIEAVPAGTVTRVPATIHTAIPSDAEAAAINVTATEPVDDGFLTVFPCGTDVPTTSTVNFVGGQTVANAALLGLGTEGGVCVYNSAATHFIVDVDGFFGPGTP